MKQHWQEKLIQHVFGTQGPLDEQRLTVLGRAAINAVMGILALQAVVLLAGTVWPVHDFQDAYYTLILVELSGTLWILYLTVTRVIRRSGIDQTEVSPQDLPKARRRLRTRWLLTAPLVMLTYHLLGCLLNLNEQPFLTTFRSGQQIVGSLIFGAVFCPLTYAIQRRRIRVIDDEA